MDSKDLTLVQSKSVEPRRRGPGKRSAEFKAVLDKIGFDIPREAAKIYPTLSISMKLKLLEFLTPYCYPKLIAHSIDEDNRGQPEPMAISTEDLLKKVDNY